MCCLAEQLEAGLLERKTQSGRPILGKLSVLMGQLSHGEASPYSGFEECLYSLVASLEWPDSVLQQADFF